MDDIYIIIRVKNEENYIGRAIQSCLDFFSFPEIIIINNNSTDDSEKISRLFQHDTSLNSHDPRYTDLKIFNISDYSPGRAINLGASYSNRSNIMVFSAHCEILKLSKVDLFEQLKIFPVVFGRQLPYYYGKR